MASSRSPSRAVQRAGTLALISCFSLPRVVLAQGTSPDQPSDSAVPRGTGGAVVRPAPPAEQPAAPKVVMPRQTKFVEAVYPPEAKAAGITGSVILFLD